MDFIEFLQNEEKYNRQVTFVNGIAIMVNKEAKFSVDKYGRLFDYSVLKDTEYIIKGKINDDGIKEWYILKNEYFTGYYFIVENDVIILKSKEISNYDIEYIAEAIKLDKKKRSKRGLIIDCIISAIVFPILAVGFYFVAQNCNNSGQSCSSCDIVNTITSDGTYYCKPNYSDNIDKSRYFKLKNGKWEDESGYSGTYKISGSQITLYSETFGKETVFASGTIEDGVLKLEISYETLTFVKQ